MRKLLFLLFLGSSNLIAQDLSYYLPHNISYDPKIPTPEQVIGHKVGEWHVTHDRLVNYMKAVDAASDRVTIQQTGFTYENRPQLLLAITSPDNHRNLESIRQQHLQLNNPAKSAQLKTQDMPVVVWIGCSIHGNEPSGANASLLAVYHLAAAQGQAIEEMLGRTVILLDPSFNPDGLNRFASWVNTNKSITRVTDPNTREFNETWPSGRTNHYWFDLNRDWLPAQHPESRNRLIKFHEWKPNIFTDHHEMGTNTSFFFQPGVPSRVNNNTPKKNQELTGKIAEYHAKFLDKIGSLYYTREGYDDFYYGKGSTYPDINGGIGILFEQASSRGHAQESTGGVLTFPFTIRNQFTTMLSTIEASKNLREELLDYQRDFYVSAKKEADQFPVKGYVWGDPCDQSRNFHLMEMLLFHKIEIYELKNKITANNRSFEPGSAWLIPAVQPQFKLIKSIFEKVTKFDDSIFYDISAWTIPLAFGMPYAELNSWNPAHAGQIVTNALPPAGELKGTKSSYAYTFEWDDFSAPKLLYRLQSEGLRTNISTKEFEINAAEGAKKFGYGSVIIPVQNQAKSPDEIFSIVNGALSGTSCKLYSLQGGLSDSGIDMGSRSFVALNKPRILLFTGRGINASDAGEIWHLLDQHVQVPVSLVDLERFNRIDEGKYNVIVMAGGNYDALDKDAREKLKSWVRGGGVLIALENAVQFLANNGFTKVLFKKDSSRTDTLTTIPYSQRDEARRATDMPGSIFEARLDLSHPICFGYRSPLISVFKTNTLFMDKNNSPFNSPVMLTSKPLQSGYLHKNYEKIAGNTASLNIDVLGRGKIISMTENPNFRAFWFGTNKLFLNAVFFGSIID